MSDDETGRRKDTVLALNRLSRNTPHDFALNPDAAARDAAADSLGIEGVRKLRFEGTLQAEGRADWVLEARLGATVVQACVVTLAPVTTRIDVDVTRRYLADFVEPDGEEAEMPEDDTAEALPDRLNLQALMLEALALALPDYPRAEDAALTTRQFAAPGVAPMTDEDAKPLAGLAALRDALEAPDEDGAGGVDDGPDAGPEGAPDNGGKQG